jgi:hypothetical protein
MADENNGSELQVGSPEHAEFLNQFPEEYRNDPTIKNTTSLGSLAKQLVNAQKMIGVPPEQLLRLPGEKATPEELAAFHVKLGRPEKADAYDMKEDGLPEDLIGRKEVVAWAKDAFFKHGVPKKVGETLMAEYSQFMQGVLKKATDDHASKRTEIIQQLEKEFGGAFNQMHTLAFNAVKKFDKSGAFTKFLEDTKLGDNPEFVRIFAQVGKALGDDTIVDGGSGPVGLKLTPDQAKTKLKELESDAENVKILQDNRHPKHELLRQERTRLYGIAFPS